MNFERYVNLTKEEKQSITIQDLTVSEMRFIIDETVFEKEIDADIATYRFTKSMSHERIAEKIRYHNHTVQHRLVDITKKLNNTLHKVL